jgi:hypothetical protein
MYRTLCIKLRLNKHAAYCPTEVNLKLSLCLMKHQVMKTYGGVDVYLHTFLTLALDGSEWSVSRSGRITTGEKYY